MEAAQHNNALPTAQQQCTAVGKLVAKYRIALQNRTLPMQALAIFACIDPTVAPWSADRESGVECFPILTDEESEAAGTGSVQSGRCGQHGACHYSRHHHVIRDAGNVRDCGIISAALYLVTSNYYNDTNMRGCNTPGGGIDMLLKSHRGRLRN